MEYHLPFMDCHYGISHGYNPLWNIMMEYHATLLLCKCVCNTDGMDGISIYGLQYGWENKAEESCSAGRVLGGVGVAKWVKKTAP